MVHSSPEQDYGAGNEYDMPGLEMHQLNPQGITGPGKEESNILLLDLLLVSRSVSLGERAG